MRSFVRSALGVALVSVVLGLAACAGGGGGAGGGSGAGSARPARGVPVYVGTYTGGGSRGIYRFVMDPATGIATDPVLAGETENPSFLALHPRGRVLYAVNEVASFRGEPTGAVSAFAIDPAAGGLTLLEQQSSGGTDPCHLIVDRAGRDVLLANYNGGSVAVLPLDGEGRLRPASVVRPHAGSGPNTARQEGPHAHAILLDPAERFALSADLGADRIFVDRFDPGAGGLEANDPAAVLLEPGSGPRHIVFHPSGRYVYAINELRSTVVVFRYDAARGALDPVQTVATLPPGFSGENTAAEIAVSPDGRFLYASNRGDDSLAFFAIDAASGMLAPLGHVPAGGRTPRHFAIDPSGRWLVVANQGSDSIAFFRLVEATGRPVPAARALTVSKPVCILFAPTVAPPSRGEAP